MRPFLALFGACLLSLILYGATFGAVIHRPITVDFVGEMLRIKEDIARRTPSPKLVIFAGSNAWFSHRCETMEPVLGRPCVNFGITRAVGLDYMLTALKPLLNPGDVIYMPLEYEWYLDDEWKATTGLDAPVQFYSDKPTLFRTGWTRSLRAFFSFDIAFVADGLTEMALLKVGVRHRYGPQTMTPEGDQKGHDAAEAVPYRAYVASVKPFIPSGAAIEAPSYAKGQIADFLAWAKAHGVRVVGGLQTTFDDAPVGPDTIAAIRNVYESAGQDFLLLPGHSQYPRDCFFDTYAHLIESCQIAHSQALAAALAPMLDRQVSMP